MGKKTVGILIASLLTILFSINAFASANTTERNVKSKIKFKESVSLEDIKSKVANQKFVIEGLENITEIGDRKYYGYYKVNDKANLGQAINDYKAQYYHSLVDGIKVLEQRVKMITDDNLKKSAEAILKDTKERKQKFEQNNDIKISSMAIRGKESEIINFVKQHEKELTYEIKSK